jgi:hypothetical protein
VPNTGPIGHVGSYNGLRGGFTAPGGIHVHPDLDEPEVEARSPRCATALGRSRRGRDAAPGVAALDGYASFHVGQCLDEVELEEHVESSATGLQPW